MKIGDFVEVNGEGVGNYHKVYQIQGDDVWVTSSTIGTFLTTKKQIKFVNLNKVNRLVEKLKYQLNFYTTK